MLLGLQDWCPWCPGHMGWGGGWFMMLFWLIVLVLVALAAWSFLRGRRPGGTSEPTRDPAEEAVREQYARGEIDEETYRSRLRELRRD